MKNRESNIELLRIVLMIMIIVHHVIVHGYALEKNIKDFSHANRTVYPELFINSFVIVGVNTFIFISGYFGIKFKLRNLISIIFQAFFYSICISLVFILTSSSKIALVDFVKSILPISGNVWWYLGVYLGLYFISPFLNKGVEFIDNRQLVFLLAGLLYLDSFSGFIFRTVSGDGFTVFHFITIYLLARLLHKFDLKIKTPIRYFISLALLLFGSTLILLAIDKPQFVWRLFAYNNPLLILSAIMLFYSFKERKIQSNAINLVSSSVFGIYLIHDHPFIRKIIVYFLNQGQGKDSIFLLIINICIIVIIIFLIGASIELLRKYIFYKIEYSLFQFWRTNRWIGRNKKMLRSRIQLQMSK